MEQHFLEIKKAYDDFYKELISQGKLPLRDTGKGFWGPSVANEVFNAFKRVKLERFKNFFDLGAGDGKVVLIASLFGPNSKGMEIDSDLVHHANRIKTKLSHISHLNKAEIIHGDFDLHHLKEYDFIYVNPDRPFHRGLQDKLTREMRDEALLMVYGFEYQPHDMKKISSFILDGTTISTYMKK